MVSCNAFCFSSRISLSAFDRLLEMATEYPNSGRGNKRKQDNDVPHQPGVGNGEFLSDSGSWHGKQDIT